MKIRIPSLLLAALASVLFPETGRAYSKSGSTYTTDGSQSDVNSAISNASAGDTVNLPAGTFTWGTSGLQTAVSKAITLAGAGTGSTTIAIASSAGTYGSGTINITAAAVVRDFTVTTSANSVTPFSCYTTNGWRITNIIAKMASSSQQYFCYAASYGLIDNCTISGPTGDSELIFARGPSDSWQTAASMGTANAVYVEDCSFTGQGYVCDANSNARMVVRFCTVTNASSKVDGHGIASNGAPRRGVRQMEVYNNHWTATTGYANMMELRGGTGIVFDNVSDNTQSSWAGFAEYGCYSNAYFGVYLTPKNYPVPDQVGGGVDVTVNATACQANHMYIILTPGSTSWTSIGAANNNAGTVFTATGPGSGTGTCTYTPAGAEPFYWVHNLVNGSNWGLTWGSIPSDASSAYGSTFSMGPTDPCMIHSDTDYFDYVASGFNGTTGTGRGTKAAMQAITPKKTGVGFWVTDEGSWRAGYSGTSGQFYVWNGSAWVLKYTPFTYPHPLRSVAVIPSNGITTISVK